MVLDTIIALSFKHWCLYLQVAFLFGLAIGLCWGGFVFFVFLVGSVYLGCLGFIYYFVWLSLGLDAKPLARFVWIGYFC